MIPLRAHFDLFVPGQPVPQGSKSGFVNKKTGRVQIVDKDVRLPAWRMKVTAHAIDAIQHHTVALDYPLTGPVGVRIDFVMPRPKGHYGTGKNESALKPSAPKYPASMPDLDKLLRAIFDALTDAQVWKDDGQVVWCQVAKHYDGPTWPGGIGVHITLGAMP
jgi:crossover junction endodeoxyribonuclease RusA